LIGLTSEFVVHGLAHATYDKKESPPEACSYQD